MHRNFLLAAMLATVGEVIPFPPGPETMPTPPKRPRPTSRDADVPDDLVWRPAPRPPTPEGAARLTTTQTKHERKAAKRRGDK